MKFIASLDIMNDVLSGDIDRRIFNLLLLKKEDLHLVGNFDVVDADSKVIASSEIDHLGKTSENNERSEQAKENE